jgi:hypothetical protein
MHILLIMVKVISIGGILVATYQETKDAMAQLQTTINNVLGQPKATGASEAELQVLKDGMDQMNTSLKAGFPGV